MKYCRDYESGGKFRVCGFWNMLKDDTSSNNNDDWPELSCSWLWNSTDQSSFDIIQYLGVVVGSANPNLG